MSMPSSTPHTLFIGIDWADESHCVCHIDSRNDFSHSCVLLQEPEAIRNWVEALRDEFPNHRKCVIVEQSHGALVSALAEFPEMVIHPINPKQLSAYRKANFPSGKKDDQTDAALLARFLKENLVRLRPLVSESPETRLIDELVEMRRKIVNTRTGLVEKLRDTLKKYFPLPLGLFGEAKFYHPLILGFLRKWTTFESLQAASDDDILGFLAEHGMTKPEKRAKVLSDIRAGKPLTTDRSLITAKSLYVGCLLDQIETLNRNIETMDREIAKAEAQHPDRRIFRSLPGAGPVLAPRLLVAFGSDRNRYRSPEELQAYSGTAPIKIESGKSSRTARRYFCPKFLKQSFHEFADQSTKWSKWAKAFYRMKKASGMKHHAALRALAYKWIRIIFHLWKTHTTYSEACYMESLKRTNSPVLKFMEN